jgi:hypothetical protein
VIKGRTSRLNMAGTPMAVQVSTSSLDAAGQVRIDQRASCSSGIIGETMHTSCEQSSSAMYRRLAERYSPPQHLFHRRHLAPRTVLPTEAASFHCTCSPGVARVQGISAACITQSRRW